MPAIRAYQRRVLEKLNGLFDTKHPGALPALTVLSESESGGYYLKNVRIQFDRYPCYLSQSNQIVKPLTVYPWGAELHPQRYKLFGPTVKHRHRDTSIVWITPEADNYFHFLLDAIPRLACLDEIQKPQIAIAC